MPRVSRRELARLLASYEDDAEEPQRSYFDRCSLALEHAAAEFTYDEIVAGEVAGLEIEEWVLGWGYHPRTLEEFAAWWRALDPQRSALAAVAVAVWLSADRDEIVRLLPPCWWQQAHACVERARVLAPIARLLAQPPSWRLDDELIVALAKQTCSATWRWAVRQSYRPGLDDIATADRALRELAAVCHALEAAPDHAQLWAAWIDELRDLVAVARLVADEQSRRLLVEHARDVARIARQDGAVCAARVIRVAAAQCRERLLTYTATRGLRWFYAELAQIYREHLAVVHTRETLDSRAIIVALRGCEVRVRASTDVLIVEEGVAYTLSRGAAPVVLSLDGQAELPLDERLQIARLALEVSARSADAERALETALALVGVALCPAYPHVPLRIAARLALGETPVSLSGGTLTRREAHEWLAAGGRDDPLIWLVRELDTGGWRPRSVLQARWAARLHAKRVWARQVLAERVEHLPDGQNLLYRIVDILHDLEDEDLVQGEKTSLDAALEAMRRRQVLALAGGLDPREPLCESPAWTRSLPQGARLLSTVEDLVREHEVMKHCVDTYVSRVVSRELVIVSITAPDGSRSTAALRKLHVDQDQWSVVEHRAARNAPPTQACVGIAAQIERLAKGD